jgi:hypothetical protein
MVSSLLVDTLKDPTCSLIELYDTCTSPDDFPALVSQHFSDIFKKVDAFQEVSFPIFLTYALSNSTRVLDTPVVCQEPSRSAL